MKSWKLKIYVVLLFLLVIGGIFTWTKKEALADMIVNAWMGYRLTSGLVGYWTFDGKDTNWGTNTTNDVSGQGNTGTLTSMSTTTSPVAGKIGQGLKFVTANTQYVSINSGLVGNGTAFTVAAWFRTVTTANFQGIYYEARSTDDVAFMGPRLSSTGVASCGIRDNSYVDASLNSTLTSYGDGKWHHIVCVQSSKSARTMYIDGVQNTSNTTTLGTLTIDRNTIGYLNRLTPGHAFNGSLDDVRIYNRALSADEARALYQLGR